MTPDASLVAVLVAIGAALVASAGAGFWLLARRISRGSAAVRDRMLMAEAALRRDVPVLRGHMDVVTARVDVLRTQWAASDVAVVDMTDSLASIRGSLEGLTRGRLAALIRGAGIVSKMAQVALLWR